MKKIKLISILIITMFIMILFNGEVYGRSQKSVPTIGSWVGVSEFNFFYTYNNVYCVEFGQQLKSGKSELSFTCKSSIKIKGNTATFIRKEEGKEGTVQVNASENNVLAAILCPDNLERGTQEGGFQWAIMKDERNLYTVGGRVSPGAGSPWVRSDAQYGLHYYWQTWCAAMEAASPGILENHGIKTDITSLGGDYKLTYAINVIEQAKELADTYNFSTEIYYLEAASDGVQNLVITFPGPYEEKGVKVKKVWHDDNNKYQTRPDLIEVQLYANGNAKGEKIELNRTNSWQYEWEDLPETDDAGNTITYEVKEVNPGYDGYVTTISGDGSSGYTITNTLQTEVTVIKEWDDRNDLDELRPEEINITLYRNNDAVKTATLNIENGWKHTFDGLNMCDLNGNVIEYSVKEDAIPGYTPTYTPSVDTSNGNTTITIKNTHTPNYAGYIEITGKVWEDIPNGKANAINGVIDEDEKGLGGIKVTLKDKDGNQFDATSTAITAEDGTYTIKVNYDNSQEVYKLYGDDSVPNKKTEKQITETKLKTAYIEFEYDGYVYTTVANGGIGDVNKSKAKEEYGNDKTDKTRAKLDSKYSTITSASIEESKILEEDKMVIATTKNVITNFITYRDQNVNGVTVNNETRKETQTVKYCNGDGTYIRTNPNGAWNEIIQGEHTCKNCIGKGHSLREYDQIEVKTIKNVNLGLFKREKPDLSIKEDINLVEVVENGKTLKYKYDTVVTDENEEDVKVQFANKQTYTYRRPVSPTLIEEFIEKYDPTKSKTEILQVYVTYAVKITNESSKLKVKVNSITNCFDNRYELESVKIGTKGISAKNIQKYTNQTEESIYKQPAEDYTEIKLNNLGLTMNAGGTSSIIYLRYKVSIDAVMELLNKDATISNAVEIESYTTYYGSTSYPSKGSVSNNVYAGYDKDSHPGNAGIKAQEVDYKYTFTDEDGNKQTVTYEDVNVLKSTENLVKYKLPDGTEVQMPEDDTDIAPSFLLDGPDEDETTKVKVTKKWDDEDNKDGIRPEAITVNLKNGETIVETAILNQSNNWTYMFRQLPKYSNPDEENGENKIEINYTVEEEEIEGYTPEITGNMNEGYIITNTHIPLPETTTLSGIVFEDTDVITGDKERLGNGKYDLEEKTVENVKIELYELVKDEQGNITGSTITQHYNEAGEQVPAIVYSNENGNYSFKIFEKGKDYFMKFTYGDDKTELADRVTKIKDIKIPVNARNYKSTTIVDDNPIRGIFEQNYTDTEFDKMWYKAENINGYSIAVDNMLDRLAIEDLEYSNFKEENGETYIVPENMTAYSKPFLIPENNNSIEIDTFNFGIIERPREELIVDKTITNFQIKLANGQTLTGGKPGDANIPYVKAVGFTTNGTYKLLSVEMDTELIQGAYLTADYNVTVTNMNEVDYDYGDTTDYTDIVAENSEADYDNFITKNELANYYYYGKKETKTGTLNEMQATITLVDYMNAEPQVEGEGWKLKNIGDIEALISPSTKTVLQDKQYKILDITEGDSSSNEEMKIKLRANGGTFTYSAMSISKTLANNEDNTYDNNLEILAIDGKTARTIKAGGVDYKDYKPGNLILAEGGDEQDDDIVKITITPPTGIGTYIIYIVTAVAGLVIIALGVIYIKKKILIK